MSSSHLTLRAIVFFLGFITYFVGAILEWPWWLLAVPFLVWAWAFLEIQWLTWGRKAIDRRFR
jgi:hypothetical protein